MTENRIRTTCSYCSVGCNFNASYENEKLKSFLPAKNYPVNLGKSCPKGFHMLKAFEAKDRVKQPMIRNEEGTLIPTDWDTAIATFVERFKNIHEKHGPESAAFLSTGQMPMEEMVFLGVLFKLGMGFVHADGNTRQCMATAAVAYKQSFGFDAPPLSYKDFEESDLMIFVGSNPIVAHPVMWNRVKMNKKDATIIVIDPRRTKTAEAADLHLSIKPKSDLALLYAITNELIRRDWIDHDFIRKSTDGFDKLKSHVTKFDLDSVAEDSGIEKNRIEDLIRRIHEAEAMSMWWTMGVNQSHQAVRTAQAIINICLITGNIGRPGTGPNSITGQANAMGSRLYSNTTALPALYNFTKESDRRTVADIIGIDQSNIPDKNSLPYHRILEEARKGSIKALWFVATNPGHSWINKNEFFKAAKAVDFLVVEDLYLDTETAELADLILPAAGSGEKDGTFINSERRIGIVQKVIEAPGDALPDFEIYRKIAQEWGCGDMFAEWSSPEAVFRILQRLSAGRPCDISGIKGYEMLRKHGGIQWPFPKSGADEAVERRLFADGRFFTENGRAKLLFTDIEPVPEEVDHEYLFVLLTGRGTVAQFHTQTRTGRVETLRKLYPEHAYIQINPGDALKLGIVEGSDVNVRSRRAEIIATAAITDRVKAGELFMPMHYRQTNFLTFPSFDTYSFEPAYKYAAVSVIPKR